MPMCVHAEDEKPAPGKLDITFFLGCFFHPCLHVCEIYKQCRPLHHPPKPYTWLFMSFLVANVIITFWSYQVCLDVGSLAQGTVSMLADNDVSAPACSTPFNKPNEVSFICSVADWPPPSQPYFQFLIWSVYAHECVVCKHIKSQHPQSRYTFIKMCS